MISSKAIPAKKQQQKRSEGILIGCQNISNIKLYMDIPGFDSRGKNKILNA